MIKDKIPKRVKRPIKRILKIRPVISKQGIYFSLATKDRKILERIILPYFSNSSDFKNIIFIGCEWPTKPYQNFFKNQNYWTIDIAPEKKKYGAKNHIIDSVENITSHFGKDKFDLIVCNGVYGWGLNEIKAAEQAFKGCYECLRPGGVFILGWNNLPKRQPFPLDKCKSLQLFDSYIFEPLNTSQYMVVGKERHIYNFYTKN